mgnify:CR=1 FL=1
MPACARPGVYVPRQTHDCDAAVLVRQHLPGFLAGVRDDGARGGAAARRGVHGAEGAREGHAVLHGLEPGHVIAEAEVRAAGELCGLERARLAAEGGPAIGVEAIGLRAESINYACAPTTMD